MRHKSVVDGEIAVIATAQGGVIGAAQLCALALDRSAIRRRVRAGRLHPLHHGVYAVGHRVLGIEGRWWAAVIACGPGTSLGFASGGGAWGVGSHGGAVIDVIVGPGGRSRRVGIRMHRVGPLPADELTTLRGLPITTPARTLLDLAASGLRARQLELAVDRAHQLQLLDFDDLRELTTRYPKRPGSPLLKAVVERYEPRDTRSRLEELVWELCATHGIPRPHVNTVIEGKVRDFCWPRQRLVVEADGYAWHRSPSALADDRERDVELTLAGWRTLRFTWTQVTRRPGYVRRAILHALATG
jgi:very-short-patch-repair endonuclease